MTTPNMPPLLILDDPAIVRARPRKAADRSSRELFAIAAAMREGVPLAGTPAAAKIAAAEQAGAFSLALDLRAEVRRDAYKIDRMARARAKQERRGTKRRSSGFR